MANNMLAALEPLLGDWDAFISETRFLDKPDATIKGEAGIKRELDGAVVVMRASFKDAHVPLGQWVIGADDDHRTYSALYHDNRGVARLFQMSFLERVLEFWRYAPGFSQRFSAQLDKAGRILAGEWQFSHDNVSWHRDFRVTYTRRS